MTTSILVFAAWTTAAAQHVLQPAIPLSAIPLGQGSLAVDGETDLLVAWQQHDRVGVRTSTDGGQTFSPEIGIARIAQDPWSDLTFAPTNVQPVAIADGIHFVVSGLEGTTSWFPPFGLPGLSTLDVVTLYSDAGGAFGFDTRLVDVSDVCNRPELGCAWVRGMGQASLDLDDTGDVRHLAFAAWDLQSSNREGEIWVQRATAAGRPAAPINLSRALLATDGNEYDPSLVTDATGQEVYATFLTQATDWKVVLAASQDGGRTWALRQSRALGYYDPDVDLARDAGVLVWSYLAMVTPSLYGVLVRTSTDGGLTFGPEVELARRRFVGPVEQLVSGPVWSAISRDGTTIAVVHQEERCQPALGCNTGVGDLVLNVSEDGGRTFVTTVVAASTNVSPYGFYDLGISDSGDVISLLWWDRTGTRLSQAVR